MRRRPSEIFRVQSGCRLAFNGSNDRRVHGIYLTFVSTNSLDSLSRRTARVCPLWQTWKDPTPKHGKDCGFPLKPPKKGALKKRPQTIIV